MFMWSFGPPKPESTGKRGVDDQARLGQVLNGPWDPTSTEKVLVTCTLGRRAGIVYMLYAPE